MSFDYYKAPDQDVFDEIKRASIELWRTYDDTYGYASQKISRIKDIENVRDNAWYMVAMFDQFNQIKLIKLLNEKARTAVLEVLEWSYSQV